MACTRDPSPSPATTTTLPSLFATRTLPRTHMSVALILSLFLFFLISTSPTSNDNDRHRPSTVATSGIINHQSDPRLSSSIIVDPVREFLNLSSDSFTHSTSTVGLVVHGGDRKNSSRRTQRDIHGYDAVRRLRSCDVFDGVWVFDDDRSPVFYRAGTCPFMDDTFNCFKNGRPDSDYYKYRWKPRLCHAPRFDGKKMLRMLRGKRVVYVGDSLNRNMWQSLVCALWESSFDKTKVFEASGKRELRTQGHYSIVFTDYKCSIDFIKSPYLVQEGRVFDRRTGRTVETLRLDKMHTSASKLKDANVLIFNTGHWWTHQKAYTGKSYFQDGDRLYARLNVADAYHKALKTWGRWVDSQVDRNRTKVFFRGYSASHFRGGQWNSGGTCDGETQPASNDTYVAPHPWMMSILESVTAEMKTPVTYLNITRMTGYRKDGHPSIYRPPEARRSPRMIQDCSHWCLPGVPDSWNELLYVTLLTSHLERPIN